MDSEHYFVVFDEQLNKWTSMEKLISMDDRVRHVTLSRSLLNFDLTIIIQLVAYDESVKQPDVCTLQLKTIPNIIRYRSEKHL